MINNRPQDLLNDPDYQTIPAPPIPVDLSALPSLVFASLSELGGVQPITVDMAESAGGHLTDLPSAGEVELHRQLGSQFQMISVVVSVIQASRSDEPFLGRPYAISLIPAQKRGKVAHVSIDFIDKMSVDKLVESSNAYLGYNPFAGKWSLFGHLSLLIGDKPIRGFVDELGLVHRHYFLANSFDPDRVAMTDAGFTNPKAEEKYRRKRMELLYKPFTKVEARQIWGAQSPIELFLMQELTRRGLKPQLQILIMDDGNTYPSLPALWKDLEFRHMPGMVTEADFFFPSERVAVFCDSRRFHRGAKAEKKDAVISERLLALGITPVRVPGPLIVSRVTEAADFVCKALEKSAP